MNCKKWLLLTICLVAAATGYAGVNVSDTLTAAKVFAEIPLDVLDMLRPSTRLDMLDYYTQADSILTVQNALGGESRLEQVEQDYLKVLVTPVSTLEIKLLPLKKGNVIMTLYTVGDTNMAQDTDVRFFDQQLSPLDPKKFMKVPELTDFFSLKGSGLDEDDLREKVPYTALVYSIGPGDILLTATLTTLRTISLEDRDLLTPLLTPTLTAPWKNKFIFR